MSPMTVPVPVAGSIWYNELVRPDAAPYRTCAPALDENANSIKAHTDTTRAMIVFIMECSSMNVPQLKRDARGRSCIGDSLRKVHRISERNGAGKWSKI